MKKIVLFTFVVMFSYSSQNAFAAGNAFTQFMGQYEVKTQKCYEGQSHDETLFGLEEVSCSDEPLVQIIVSEKGEGTYLTEGYGPAGSSVFPIFEHSVEFPNGSTVNAVIFGSEKHSQAMWVYESKHPSLEFGYTSEVRSRSIRQEDEGLYYVYSEAITEKSESEIVQKVILREYRIEKTSK